MPNQNEINKKLLVVLEDLIQSYTFQTRFDAKGSTGRISRKLLSLKELINESD